MMNDEIISELRATKLKLAELAGFDMQRLVKQIQQEEAASAAMGITVLQSPAANAEQAGSRSAFQRIRFTHS
jgi:hypothetical protein